MIYRNVVSIIEMSGHDLKEVNLFFPSFIENYGPQIDLQAGAKLYHLYKKTEHMLIRTCLLMVN